MSATNAKWLRRAAVAAMLASHAALVAHSSWVHAPGLDEPAHLVAGLSYYEFGRFELYKVNPPLTRLLAALPVMAVDHRTDWSHYVDALVVRAEFAVGDDFVAANGSRSFWLFTLARFGVFPLSLIVALVCERWARELFGQAAGLAALCLWCFAPNVLAYAATITPDIGATALGAGANYLFWKWLRDPRWPRAAAAGVVLGLAELTKTTWVVLFALWPIVAAAWWLAGQRKWSDARRLALQTAAALGLALYTINAIYGFEGTGKPLGKYLFASRMLGSQVADAPYGNRFAQSWLGRAPVPFPSAYIAGIDMQRRDFERGKPSYFRGEWRVGGYWYYYLHALAVKTPLGTLSLVALAAVARCGSHSERAACRDELVLLGPLFAGLILVSSQTGFARYLRYVLPIAPYAFIWASGVFSLRKLSSTARYRQGAIIRLLAGAALAWSVVSSLLCAPHSMSYFNEFAGGPLGGHRHLVDANIDWGQDLLILKRWVDDHPDARPLRLAYFGVVDPSLGGINYTLPPKVPPIKDGTGAAASKTPKLAPGWYAVSVNFLRGYERQVRDGSGALDYAESGCFAYFLELDPVATVGYSIYVYQVELEGDGASRPSG